METYKPYMKPGNVPQYVHCHSNHPPSILRSIPETINKRLSNISSNQQSFDSAIPPYQEALKRSGYNYALKFHPQPTQPKKSRTRNVIWFNPPYSRNVSTNIGHKFLQIIDECFTPNHPLRSICNRNTLKLSYSCMPNIGNIINAHNKHILKEEPKNSTPKTAECNCRQKGSCPLAGKCLTEGVVYQAKVKRADNLTEETYIGLTEGSFKARYNNHTSSFRNAKHRNRTKLSQHIWSLKDSNISYSLSWRIMKHCKAYSRSSKRCSLCLHEKFMIICHPHLATLNTRNELVSTCKHRKKHLLSS